jgi:hypothetical protein
MEMWRNQPRVLPDGIMVRFGGSGECRNWAGSFENSPRNMPLPVASSSIAANKGDRRAPGTAIVPERPIRTYLDSGVLITAFNARPDLREPALRILEDIDRVFLTSSFVRLEVSPKALFNNRTGEHRFYQTYFRRAHMTNDLNYRRSCLPGGGKIGCRANRRASCCRSTPAPGG